MVDPQQTPSRKRDHVELCADGDVRFRAKSTGFERYELLHNALPEIDFEEVDSCIEFAGVRCGMPLLVTSMTGGYAEAEAINAGLGRVCEALRIPMGVGSQRQALEDERFHGSYRAARRAAPSIPIIGNIGAAELVRGTTVEDVRRLRDIVDANVMAVHLNPLQELMQPEGTPAFRGVLGAIERLVAVLGVPVMVKEVGAGLSGSVVQRLLDVGVRSIDVAGAGGTSWSGVEILRRADGDDDAIFWDWGIPTAECVRAARASCERAGATLIASGGIAGPMDIALALALGAGLAGCARPLLQSLRSNGEEGLIALLERWRRQLRGIMFLTGSRTVEQLRQAPVVWRG